MKTKRVWSIAFAVAIAICICIGTFAILAVEHNAVAIDEEFGQVKTNNDFTAEIVDSEYVKLSFRAVPSIVSDNSLSKTLIATIYPSTASNQLVDWSIEWKNASKIEEVTDYVTVTPTHDGSKEATVTCFQPFGSELIIITVTTRQGGYTAECIVSFQGVASSMNMSSESALLTSNEGRGEYYNLLVSNDTVFTINLSNVWDTVSLYNLSVEIIAEGSLYFCDTSSDVYGNGSFTNITLHEISEFIDDLGLTANIDGNNVTVTATKVLDSDFYSRRESDEMYTRTYDSYVYYEEWMEGLGVAYSEEYKTAGAYNVSHLDSCYFVLKVTDSVSGLSVSAKFWLSTGVSSVQLNENTLVF